MSFGTGKLEWLGHWAWLPDGEKISKVCFFVLYRMYERDIHTQKERQTDRQTPHDGIASRGKNRDFRPIYRFILEMIQDT